MNTEEGKDGEEGDNQESDSEQDKPPMLVVECYDPQSPSLKFVKETYLYKNDELEPFIKNKNSLDFLKESSFATNGKVLMVKHGVKEHFFDMKSGVKVFKHKEDSEQADKIAYDCWNNLFYRFSVEDDNTNMKIFSITNFKKGQVGSGFTKDYLSNRICLFRQALYGDNIVSDGPGEIPNKFNLI